MSIPIYKQEKEAGLAEAIKSSASIAYLAEAKPFHPTDEFQETLAKLEHPALAKANDNDSWDLFWINSILVSIGWNKNDDVFDPGETWGARHTPVYKQFNFMHNEKDIIGTMVASIVLDANGDVIPDSVESVPNIFDIAVASVIYTQWSDPELQDRMNKIIAGIKNNEWFVSMECLFRNFDYAVVTPSGEQKVVARTESSSFLTKHLRIYGGTGEFEGHKIGRLLRNFTFSGKGLVDNPANPKSIIFGQGVDPFKSTQATISNLTTINKMESTEMADTNVNLAAELREELNKANARADRLESKLEEKVAEAQKAEREKLEKDIASLKVEIEELEKTVSTQTEDIESKGKAHADLQKQLDDANAKVSELEKQVEEAEAEKVKADRISKLVEVGMSADEATKVADRWADASDEQFGDIVQLHKVEETDAEDMNDKDKKNARKGNDDKSQASDANEANADVNLEDAEEEEDLNLSTADTNEGEALRASASEWVSGILNYGKKSEE